jgi:hypothetical protein
MAFLIAAGVNLDLAVWEHTLEGTHDPGFQVIKRWFFVFGNLTG